MYTKISVKKLGNHCRNAVDTGRIDKQKFTDRYFYNVSFVDRELFNPNCIKKLTTVHKLVKRYVTFADCVKNNKSMNTNSPDNQVVVKEKFTHGAAAVTCSKNEQVCGNDVSSTMIVNDKVSKQGGSHMCNSKKPRITMENQGCVTKTGSFIHTNRFQPLSDIQSNTVNKCHDMKVSTVVEGVGTNNTCDIPVEKGKQVAKVIKGKNTKLLYSKCNNILARAHVNSCRSSAGTVTGRTLPSRTDCDQIPNETRRGSKNCDRSMPNTDDDQTDKYTLELHISNKSQRIREAKAAPDNDKCIKQNRPLFGFIPIYGLKSRVYDHSNKSVCTDIIQLHKKLRADGRPNYMGLQIPLASKLNYDKWAAYLDQYWDWQLPLLIKYGFPLDFDRSQVVHTEKINHRSATEYPDHVTTYLQEEIANNAMLGPFEVPPIDNLHISPFMTRDKSSSTNRRVIIDLSWPIGHSVNAGVHSDRYLGTDFILTYPSVDNLTNEVLRLGKGSQIFKVDISRAFRHVPIDPGDLDLLGLYWESYFLDFSLPFGFKHGSSIFQRISDAVRYIMSQEGHSVWNYIDDFLCISVPSKIEKTYTRLQELLAELGLSVSDKKLVPPSTRVTCLGIVIDTTEFTMSIPTEKLQAVKDLCSQWCFKQKCTKRELQSLLGSLLYVAKCVKYARFFLNRMLQLLRQNVNARSITVTEEFKRDLNWFLKFLNVYNGVSFFNYVPAKTVHLDACPTGLGAIWADQVYAMALPQNWLTKNIAYTEMVNILVALKVWHRQWTGTRILIRCDNLAVVSVLTTGKTRDSTMAKYARNIFLWLSAFNIDIMVVHIAGKLNPVADLLSRWNVTNNNVVKLQQLVHPVTWVPTPLEYLYCDDTI